MRGRPREECNDPQRRRKYARVAQSRLRERRTHFISDMQSKINLLEDIIERLGTSFDAFGAVILKSDVFSNYKDVASSFRDTLRIFSSLSQIAHLESSESQQLVPLNYEQSKPELQQLPQSSVEADQVSIRQDNASLEIARSDPLPTATRPPLIVQFGLPRSLSVLSIDYWGDALLKNSDLPFWQLLFRSTLLESHRFLRQKHSNGSENSRMAHAHAYSFRISDVTTILRVNSISLQAIAMEDEDSHDPEHNKASVDTPAADIAPNRQSDQYFDLDFMHGLGARLRKEMASDGASIEDFIDAREVEAYLLKKGMVHFDRHRLQMRINLGKSGNQSSHSTLSTLMISTHELVRRLVNEAICLGDGVGYSESQINSAIIASVTEIV
ncbi:hypothetical protein ACHAQJ_001570 [Trichoderma viride]